MRPKSVEMVRAAARPEDFPRDGRPEVVLLGRSNVGKSSLINRLVGRKGIARVSKAPGRTREIFFYLVDERAYVVDVPGFGYARVSAGMRAAWDRLLAAYLERREPLRLALQLVDSRHPPQPLDHALAELLLEHEVPFALVLTKADKVSGSRAAQAAAEVRREIDLPSWVPVVATSAHTGAGMKELSRIVDEALARPAGKDA
ncbi:MAG: ribosome biogenesis GTP-binding protein YihA/YsxC [Acidobacteria bacterium]|nr:ribosome biogenesis GTP-binding protein YihA/YsxC [Acidobacteriota bacterium]